MSTFDTQDFARLDADVIRIRIKLPDGFSLDAGRSALGARITSPAGVHEGEFRLEQVAVERALISRGLFAGDVWGTAYSLRLSAPSVKEFGDLQAFVRQGRPEGVVISVKPILSSFPGEASYVKVWIDLLLSQGQGYFTLLDAAEVPLDAIRKASAAN